MKIRVGICGYGNLGKGVEYALSLNDDMELVAVFTRRAPESLSIITKDATVCHISNILDYKDKIDVMILCGGSATDLPIQTPELAQYFNVVDSFDTHAKIYEHYNNVDAMAKPNKNTALISIGWDPGMFSVNRLYGQAILPNGKDYTFWGKGVSQGHSDAIRRIPGVVDARQYTVPVDSALEAVRSGTNPELTTRQKHTRECYVVVEDGADKNLIEKTIKEMPNYFADYDTTVNFISLDELKKNHNGIPHGGFVIRSGYTGLNNQTKHIIEYSLKLDSNPEFTSSVLVCYARACYRMNKDGIYGCNTIFDVAPKYISSASYDDLLKNVL